jgi:hypothetical protein
MPSITVWNRVEPRPRSDDINASLSAQLRDPLWLLARQWQMGEFRGEDAGSPAFVSVASSSARASSWSAGDSGDRALPEAPLESAVTREELDDIDLSLAVELGQTFAALLARSGAAAAERAFRDAFPIAATASGDDPDAARFRSGCAGRAINGVALFRRAVSSPGALPPGVTLTGDEATAALRVLDQFARSVRNLYGEINGGDPAAWDAEKLRYRANLQGAADAGAPILSATPDREGTLDWYAFDLTAGRIGTASPQTRTMMPAHASFRGMPNARFWDFEDATTDFGDVRPDRRDLSRLMLVEFMLLHANDWFVIPFEQDVGTFVRINQLIVHDVFGGTTTIARAGSADPPEGGRWAMFEATSTAASGVADVLFLPGAAAGARQAGDVLEEVRLLRDETANIVWAVEHTIPGRLGTPRSGHEAALDGRPALPPAPTRSETGTSLRYRIQTAVPRNWVPFVPVLIDAASGQIGLELAGMLSGEGAVAVTPSQPAGRLLKPESARGRVYRLREEEVPRSGVRLARLPSLSRWTNGQTYLWWARRRSAGAGEGSSGLRFDVVEQV